MSTFQEIDELRYSNAPKALSMAKELHRRDEKKPETLALLGSCYRAVGQIEKAKKSLIRAVREAPPESMAIGDAAQRLVYVLLQEPDLEAALDYSLEAIALYSRLGEVDRLGQAHFELATVQAFSEQETEAEKNLTVSLRLLFENNYRYRFSAHLGLAHLFLRRGDFRQASREAASSQSFESRATGLARKSLEFLINLEEERGEIERAIQLADDLILEYTQAGRWLEAVVAGVWAIEIRLKAGLGPQAEKAAINLRPLLIHLEDQKSAGLTLQIIRSATHGRLISLDRLEKVRAEISRSLLAPTY